MKHSKLKRRLRKKFHIGEFQELGFEISVEFKSNLSETDFDKFYNEFIEEIEENKLLFGGGGGPEVCQGFVTSSIKYQSPTDEQREKIKIYLESLPDIAKCDVGKLKDAWYDVK